MRYLLFLFVIITSACTSTKPSPSSNNSTNTKEVELEIKLQFETILALIKKKAYNKLAPLITYAGEDRERYCKDVCNYEVANDQKQVDNLVEETIKYLGKVPKYTYEGLLLAPESEGVWHVLKIKTIYEGQSKKIGFAFLKVNGIFTYADITTDIN